MKLLSKIQAGLIAAIVSLFFIAGCSDGFSPVPVAEKGMVTVRIGNEENSRTLFPQTPVFSRYELQFTPGSGQAAKSPESVTNANTTISLATGNWTITAIAYINISGIEGIPNGEYEAARGSKNLTVQLGTNNVSIDIQGDVEDGTGIFSYAVSYPADVGVAALKVLSLEGDVLEEVDMKTDDASSGSFTLDAGYYLLRLELEKGEGKIVKTEVIHIYKNLTTPAQGDGYSFSDSDFLIITDNDISFNMVEIPGGVTFPTGTNDNGTATITYAYQMGETEVTWEQWNTVRTWAVANGYSMSEGQKGSSGDGSDQQPVTMVNWYDSIVWCNALTEYWNEKTGENLATVYNNGGSPIRDAGETSALNGVTPSVTAKGFRLPTSNEWELAARWRDDDTNTVAGYSDPWFTKGDSASGATANSNTGDVAVYQDNSGDTTSAVKNKTPNALGLYDMSGNVWEWCFETSGASSVTRGGALNDPNSYQRIGYVHSDNPIDKAYNHGFRLARTGDENEYTFTDIATLQTWLANLPANPPPAAPYLVSLTVSALGGSYNTAGSLGNALYTNNTKYVSLDLSGSNIDSIGNAAFDNCASLTSVIIPNGVISIERGAFNNTGLTSVTIPNSVESIGQNAFSSSASLTNIIIPNNVTSIGMDAFNNCLTLASVTIGNSVNSIGARAFRSTILTSVIFEGPIPSSGLSTDAFETLGNLRDKFYETDSTNGTPGLYTRENVSSTWTRQIGNVYTVTFNSMGGSTVNSVNVVDGGNITVPAAPTKTGYALEGWYKEPDFTNVWNFATDTVIENITLYAKWIAKYTITFNTDGGTPVPSVQLLDLDELVTRPVTNPAKTGYTFDDWYKDSGCTILWDFATETVTGNTTIYAKFDIKQYTVSFEADNGIPAPVQQIVVDGNKAVQPEAMTRTGYTFDNWYKEPDFTNVWNFATDTVTGNITLYAKWLTNYTVSFEADDGTPAPAQQIVVDGNKAVQPEAMTRTGYTFDNWYKEPDFSNVWNFATDTVTGNITLYAKWLTNYTVSFEADDGTPIPAQQTVADGSKAIQPEAMTKTGYTFGGWYKEAALTNTWDFAADTVTGNTTLYAKWLTNYTVSFEADGGTPSPAQQTVGDGNKAAQPPAMTKTNNTFNGWYKEAALTNVWNFAVDTVTENTTLYAKWTLNQYTVTFNSNGGSAVSPITGVYHGDTITRPTNPTSGYGPFDDWYSDADRTTLFDFDNHPITANTIVYAKWNAAYNLGATGPGGGKIFYRSEAGFLVNTVSGSNIGWYGDGSSMRCHYLEAAPNDVGSVIWGPNPGTTIGTVETFGYGPFNNDMISFRGTNPSYPAVNACRNYTSNGKSDWFLPSRAELRELYNNKEYVGNMASGDDTTYWSSSAYDTNAAWTHRFSDGLEWSVGRGLTNKVRPIRAFVAE